MTVPNDCKASHLPGQFQHYVVQISYLELRFLPMSSGDTSSQSGASEGHAEACPGPQQTLSTPEIVEIGSHFVVVSCPKNCLNCPSSASKEAWPTNSTSVCLEYRKVCSCTDAMVYKHNTTYIRCPYLADATRGPIQ